MHRAMHSRTGFTIIELLIAIVIIGILATITIVSYNGIQERSRASVLEGDLIKTAGILEKAKQASGAYPSSLSAVSVDNSDGITFLYTYTPITGSYCLSATNQDGSKYLTNTNSDIQAGLCP